MGYLREFTLETKNDYIENVVKQEDISAFDFALNIDGSSKGEVKWYSYIEAISELSEKYPEELFTLNVDGENSEDLSRIYFKNGKHYESKAIITFEEFNPIYLD